MSEEKMKMLRIDPRAVMDNFCYNFSEALLEKLEELQKENRIFSSKDPIYGFTNITRTIIAALSEQIDGFGPRNTHESLQENILLAKEFLATFETTSKTQ